MACGSFNNNEGKFENATTTKKMLKIFKNSAYKGFNNLQTGYLIAVNGIVFRWHPVLVVQLLLLGGLLKSSSLMTPQLIQCYVYCIGHFTSIISHTGSK